MPDDDIDGQDPAQSDQAGEDGRADLDTLAKAALQAQEEAESDANALRDLDLTQPPQSVGSQADMTRWTQLVARKADAAREAIAAREVEFEQKQATAAQRMAESVAQTMADISERIVERFEERLAGLRVPSAGSDDEPWGGPEHNLQRFPYPVTPGMPNDDAFRNDDLFGEEGAGMSPAFRIQQEQTQRAEQQLRQMAKSHEALKQELAELRNKQHAADWRTGLFQAASAYEDPPGEEDFAQLIRNGGASLAKDPKMFVEAAHRIRQERLGDIKKQIEEAEQRGEQRLMQRLTDHARGVKQPAQDLGGPSRPAPLNLPTVEPSELPMPENESLMGNVRSVLAALAQ